MSKVDNVVPGDKWEFDESVSECFEDMLSRSIPQYEVMRNAVVTLIGKNIKHAGFILLDIGCSDGLMLDRLVSAFENDSEYVTLSNGRFVGIDVSEPMLKKCKDRFKDYDNVYIRNCNICTEFPYIIGGDNYDAITSVLSIQFTPIEYRQKIIQNIYDNLREDGVFIMVEKVLGNTAKLNEIFVDSYYDMKRSNGYSQEQIDRKRLSLEGVLVPMTSDWNADLLKQAGFRQVDVFWRWMNFVGYIAIK